MGILRSASRFFFGPPKSELIARARAAQIEAYSITERFAGIKAKYDAAMTYFGNENHWKNADALSAAEANSPVVRKRLRERSRYEFANGCHPHGIITQMANDLIGTGARLQVLFGDEKLCDAIEARWNEWADAICLAEKLHTFEMACDVDGEAFAVLTTNRGLDCSVQLDVTLRESEMVATPAGVTLRKNSVDGIEYDQWGNPEIYYLLREHPGGLAADAKAHDKIPARRMLHWFRAPRPGQCRGVPVMTPALPIFAQLRRYTLAVLMAAELAANFAAFIHTDQAPSDDDEDYTPPKAWDVSDIQKGMLQALPDQWKITQLQPTQPTATYGEFCKALLREAYHALMMPYNVGNADFEGDSYSGGRLSVQSYQRHVKVRRSHLKARCLNRIFSAWLNDAISIPKYLPSTTPQLVSQIPHAWFFDGWGHIDPAKEAKAITERLNNFTTTLAAECAEAGSGDWRKVTSQRAAEIRKLMAHGVLILPPGTVPPSEVSDDSDEPTIEQEEALT